MILVTVLVQGSTLPAVVRWARLPEDTRRADELRLARRHSAQAALDALPMVATELGVDDELRRRLQQEYEGHAALILASGDVSGTVDAGERNDLIRRVRLGVLDYKRRAVTDLRDRNRIDDIVLRELQTAMDLGGL